MALRGLTVFITGGSRGIGAAIGVKCGSLGANVAIAAKTATPHAKLPGTIYTACADIERVGGRALPLIVDVRNEADVQAAVDQTVAKCNVFSIF
jgi:citronellol/citronellal dehydrogenase